MMLSFRLSLSWSTVRNMKHPCTIFLYSLIFILWEINSFPSCSVFPGVLSPAFLKHIFQEQAHSQSFWAVLLIEVPVGKARPRSGACLVKHAALMWHLMSLKLRGSQRCILHTGDGPRGVGACGVLEETEVDTPLTAEEHRWGEEEKETSKH